MSTSNTLNQKEEWVCTVVHPKKAAQGKPENLPVAFIQENKLGTVITDLSSDPDESIPTTGTKEAVYSELETIVQSLDRNDIDYAIIKSVLPISKQIGDIDILVSDLPATESVLESFGYDCESHQPFKRKYSRITDLGRTAVHVHDKIAWHGQTYLDKIKILENTVMGEYPRGEVAVPCPSHEASIIAAHMLFEKANNRILLLDVLCYWVWYHNDDLDLELMHSMADEYGWEFGLRCFLAGVADVYEQVYDEPFDSDNTLKTMAEFSVPYNRIYGTFLISFRQMYSIRKHRLEWLARNEDVRSTAHCFQTYVRDFVTELTNRYGFTYTKKRLRQ